MLRAITKNFRKPKGFIGAIVLNRMNKHHARLTKWALGLIGIQKTDVVLDVGCGGGNAVRLMAGQAEMVYGVDYSEASVKASRKTNAQAIQAGRVAIEQGDVSRLRFEDGMFDVVTAFETIYFWPAWASDFKEVCRVVKPGGRFAAVFEIMEEDGKTEKMQRKLDMKVPTEEQMEQLLAGAGFAGIKINRQSNGIVREICVIGEKA